MNINKNILIALLLAISALFVGMPTTSANTQTAPLAILKEGTNQTSYAASYFSNSASVTSVGNGQYTVTSTVTTDKSLGNYPVQIMSINGGAANTSKSDNGKTQTITYSFQTNNLKARQNAVIKVDVDSINYHHVYNVGLQVDASSVKEPVEKTASEEMSPAEATPRTNKQEAAQSKQSAMSTEEKTKDMSELPEVETDKADKTASENKSAKKESAFAYNTEKKSANSQAKESGMTEGRKQNNATKKSDTTNKIIMFIGSGLAVGILAAGGMIWFTSRKK